MRKEYSTFMEKSGSKKKKKVKPELWRMQNKLKWWRMKDRNVLTDQWKESAGKYKKFTEGLMNEHNDKTEMVEWWRYNKECERWTRTNRGPTHYQSTLVVFRRMAWIAWSQILMDWVSLLYQFSVYRVMIYVSTLHVGDTWKTSGLHLEGNSTILYKGIL